MSETTTKVVIIGAGPVGLSAACQLLHLGIDFIIIDKKTEPTKTSNAILINMQTLQLLKPLGITDQLIEQGLHLKGMSIYANKNKIANLDMPSNAAFEYMLTLPQSKTETILRKHLHENGVEIKQSHQLTKTLQHPQHVEINLTTPSGEEKITADWLFACDGTHSKVCELENIKGYRHGLSQHFVMIDAIWQTSEDKLRVCAFTQPDLTMGVIPYAKNGEARLLAEVSRSKQFNNIELPDLNDFKNIAKQCIPFSYEISNLSWASKFIVTERIADKFQKHRVFLLGDAAHSHSPAGGMGMNTGIQDACNLCWKINLAINNIADEKILTTYNLERRQVAQNVINISNRMTRAATLKNPILCALRNFLMRIIMKSKARRDNISRINNQLDIKYPAGQLTHTSRLGDLIAGSSAPDFSYKIDEKKYSLYENMNYKNFYVLCFSKNTEHETLPEKIADYKIAITIISKDRLGARKDEIKWPDSGFIVIRPDAYIGLATADVAKVVDYFEGIV